MDKEYREARESWRGASYEEVVAAWGPAARNDEAGSQQTYTWFTEDAPPAQPRSGVSVGVGTSRGSGGGSVGIGVGGMIFGGGPSAQAKPTRCDRTLVFRDGRVVDENWAGDAEFCSRFKRPK